MKFRIFLLVLLLPLFGWAQQETDVDTGYVEDGVGLLVPDYDYLKTVINDKSSPFYYPKLLKRFAAADTSLSIEELHCLYYGYVLQPDYNPYLHPEEVDEALKFLNKDEVSKKEAKKAIKLLNKAIAETPVHLPLYAYRHYANSVLYGIESKQAAEDAFRYLALMGVVRSSGLGNGYDNAFHVAITNHSYLLMQYYGFNVVEQALSHHDGRSYDIFTLEENDYGIESLYFDVTTCLNSLSKLFGDDDEPSDVEQSDVEQYDIGLGTKVTIRLGEQKKGVYRFSVEQIDIISDTLELDDAEKLVPEEGDPNTIVFYCVYGRWSSGKNCVLLTIKNYTDVNLSYDTYMMIGADGQFRPTSNDGIFSKVVGTEIWNDPVSVIRIANLRDMK